VRMKKFRLLLIHTAGRMNRNNCVMGLRLRASPETMARMQKVWAVFALPTKRRRGGVGPREGRSWG